MLISSAWFSIRPYLGPLFGITTVSKKVAATLEHDRVKDVEISSTYLQCVNQVSSSFVTCIFNGMDCVQEARCLVCMLPSIPLNSLRPSCNSEEIKIYIIIVSVSL